MAPNFATNGEQTATNPFAVYGERAQPLMFILYRSNIDIPSKSITAVKRKFGYHILLIRSLRKHIFVLIFLSSQVLLDAEVVGTDSVGSGNALSDVINTVTMGCRYNGGSYTAYSSGRFDELVMFPMYLNETFEHNWLDGRLG